MALISVFNTGESVSRVRAVPCACRGCVVVQQEDLVVREDTIASVDCAPPRVAQAWRELLDRDWAFVQLDVPSSTAGIVRIARASRAAVKRVYRSGDVTSATMTLVTVFDAREAISGSGAVGDTVFRGIIREHGCHNVLEDTGG